MKHALRRVLSVIAALLLVLTTAACSSPAPSAATTPSGQTAGAPATDTPTVAPTEAPTAAAPVKITSLHSDGNVPSENPSVLEEVRKRTGIDWQPILVGPADSNAKLNAMIVSNDLPDLFSFDLVNGQKYAQNGLLTKLDDLLAQYGKDIMDNRGDYMHTGLNGNGTIWGVPGSPYYQVALAVRTDWLKNLNMELPTTLDDFYNVLKAFTNDDPDKDGKKDTIGMAACILYDNMWVPVFGAYGIPYKTPIMVNGTVTSYMMHPNYMEAVKFFRKLYQEGLMEPDFSTIPNMDCLNKLWNGTYGSICFSPVGTTNNWLGRYTEDPKPTFGYTVVKGPDGKGGVPEVRPAGYYGIASTCKNPDAAMKLANYLGTSEGDELLYFGIEGKHYKWIDKQAGTYEYIPPYNDSATHRSDGAFIFWPMFSRWTDNAEIRTMTAITREALTLSKNNTLPDAFIFGTPESQAELGTTLMDIEKEALCNLIVSKGDIEAEYQKYVQQWLDQGGKTWQEQATAIYKSENPGK